MRLSVRPDRVANELELERRRDRRQSRAVTFEFRIWPENIGEKRVKLRTLKRVGDPVETEPPRSLPYPSERVAIVDRLFAQPLIDRMLSREREREDAGEKKDAEERRESG